MVDAVLIDNIASGDHKQNSDLQYESCQVQQKDTVSVKETRKLVRSSCDERP